MEAEVLHLTPLVEVAFKATELAELYPVDGAIAHLTDYVYDTEEVSAAKLLLSIHARYDVPVEEVASVLLAVHRAAQPTQTETVRVPTADPTDLPPLDFTISTGLRLATPRHYETVDAYTEEVLPDNWNVTYPHTPEELERRAQVAQNIAEFLSTGIINLAVRSNNTLRIVADMPNVQVFSDYAEDCQTINQLVLAAQTHVSQIETRRQQLHELQRTAGDNAEIEAVVIDGLLQARQVIHGRQRPTQPAYLRQIPTRNDDAMLTLDSHLARRQLDQHDRQARQVIQKGAAHLRDRLHLIASTS